MPESPLAFKSSVQLPIAVVGGRTAKREVGQELINDTARCAVDAVLECFDHALRSDGANRRYPVIRHVTGFVDLGSR